MRYAKPLYEREQVNQAGKSLLDDWSTGANLSEDALDVLNNWRAAHAYPAQTIFMTLKRKANEVDKSAKVAQRIKRLPSILAKLGREKKMRLSQMQDIGGCRAILGNIEQLKILKKSIEASRWRHEKLEPKDYLANPKNSGYRGIHLKYKFKGSGSKDVFNGLKIEVQLRTLLQHKWATAVETVDTFTNQSVKSSMGEPGWQRFFALMSSVFALSEKSPLVPGTPDSLDQLCLEIKALCDKHQIISIFAGFATAVKLLGGRKKKKNSRYFLVTLNPTERTLRLASFGKEQSQEASKAYTEAEKKIKETNSVNQVVLVSFSSINILKKIYPNYFSDAAEFLKEIKRAIKHADDLNSPLISI